MRRFQCTNRNLLSFDFGSLYDEVSPDEAKKHPLKIGTWFDQPHMFLRDKFNDIHAVSISWIANNFKELPEAQLIDDPYADHEASEYREFIRDGDERLTLRGLLICAAVGFMVAISLIALFW